MRHAILAILAAMSISGMLTPSYAQETRLQGEPEAVALAERMIERLGGAAVWARTRTLHLVYEGWRTEPDEPVIERAWRDLTRPAERIEFEGRSFEYVRVFSEDAGWHSRNGEVAPLPEDQVAASRAFWPRDFYTMIRRLAVADQALHLRLVAPRRVIIEAHDGSELCWWEIDRTGQPIRWGSRDGDEALEYVYLPVRSFGNVNFPAGGAATDGFWRFVYTTVDVSPAAMPLSREMPPRPRRNEPK